MMNRRIALQGLFSVAALSWLPGCGGRSRSEYIPPAEKARNALRTALETWKSGSPHGTIASSSGPAINIFDARWQAGKKLETYEILDEVKNPDQPQFNVKMKLAGESEETVLYLIIGIDPLNVFREEDYKKTQSM